tara:strand:- start:54 stop:287 length:234 start_codon:yes stop_codon:yes gene_type:complete
MDKDKVYKLEYKIDLDDVKQIIQEETKFVEEGWIPDSKEDRRNAIEWGLKVLQIEILYDIANVLEDIRDAKFVQINR